ncbi:hypothetical protein [Streptomyces sp. NPDC048659]|uniref:hypothetical protein n=1 Tax=Streptomyces sp. NPDC048659 TaxID=3155489 RepID=UPI003433B36F
MKDFEELINRVVAASASDLLQPPIAAAELAKAEQKLGFHLPPLLATLYRKGQAEGGLNACRARVPEGGVVRSPPLSGARPWFPLGYA